MKLGLIGKKLGHSYSQDWFEGMFARKEIKDTAYRLYPLEHLPNMHQWVKEKELAGFNVTVPYKEEIISQLDEIDASAADIGAVNCVSVSNGRLTGHNTDAPAFAETLAPLLHQQHTHALILGTGGAAKAVAYALRHRGIQYSFVSRNPSKHPNSVGYADALVLCKSHLLIVNATPIGMFPNTAETPWPQAGELTSRHLCYDLIYNPSPTLFLEQAQKRGAIVKSGLDMLYRQAELSWNIWMKDRFD